MFSELKDSVTTFIKEHKNIIFSVVVLLLIDEFVFKGAFRQRLQNIMDGLVKRIEDKVGGKA